MNLLDFLFPKYCVSCRSFGSYLCPPCRQKITRIEHGICPECTRSSMDGKIHPYCKSRYILDGLTVPLRYEGVARTLLKQLKFSPWLSDLTHTIIDITTPSLNSNLQFQTFIKTSPIIAPVPLYWSKRLLRGFNQTELLGKAIARTFQLEFTSLLNRHQHTMPQYGLNRSKRQNNVANAFSIRNHVKMENCPPVLLVDDVWTTGATMRACANVLKRSGVKQVWGFAVAR